MDPDIIPWLFSSAMTIGIVYMLASLILGELDLDLSGVFEGLDLDLDLDFDADADGEGLSIGCAAIAAFLTGFGSIGLAASMSGASLLLSIIVSIVFGYALGRVVASFISYAKNQESTTVQPRTALIGKTARVTIKIPSGKVGEALVDADQVIKYAIKEIDGNALVRGDVVRVVELHEKYLGVSKETDIDEDIRVQSHH